MDIVFGTLGMFTRSYGMLEYTFIAQKLLAGLYTCHKLCHNMSDVTNSPYVRPLTSHKIACY